MHGRHLKMLVNCGQQAEACVVTRYQRVDLSALQRQGIAVCGPTVSHDLWQAYPLVRVFDQHLCYEVLQTRGHTRLAWEGDGLCADDIVQAHDTGMLEGHCACTHQLSGLSQKKVVAFTQVACEQRQQHRRATKHMHGMRQGSGQMMCLGAEYLVIL